MLCFIENKTEISRDADGNIVKNTVKKQEVINVARIQEQLSSNFQITGLDSPKEASSLALLLRAGALAAPIYIVEERTIGPSLGADNIKRWFQLCYLRLYCCTYLHARLLPYLWYRSEPCTVA